MSDINELNDTVDHMSQAASQIEELSGRNLLQCSGSSPEYIKIFIELEDRIPIEQVRTIYDLFKKLSEYKVDHGNRIFQNRIYEAIILEPRIDQYDRVYNSMRKDSLQELEDYIAGRKQDADKEYTKEFLETLTMMIKMSGYLKFKEIFIINYMLDSMDRFNEYIYISDTEENVYAMKRNRYGEYYKGPVDPKKVITKISILGDSISTFHGYIPEDYALYYDVYAAMHNGIKGVEDIWWWKVIKLLDGELMVDNAFSGSRVTGKSFPAGNGMERIGALRGTTDVPDIILVYLGYNDYGFSAPLEYEDGLTEEEYFSAAYPLMIKRIKECYPQAIICCATLMPTYIEYRPDWSVPLNDKGLEMEAYNDVIRHTCEEHGAVLIDLYRSGIKCDTNDGAHGTKKGHGELAEGWKIYLERNHMI